MTHHMQRLSFKGMSTNTVVNLNGKNRPEYRCLVEMLLVNLTKERGFNVMSFCPLCIKHAFTFLKIDYLVSYAKEFLHGGVYRESG